MIHSLRTLRRVAFRHFTSHCATALMLWLLAARVLGSTANQPVPRNEPWMKRHEAFLQIAATSDPKVVFLGDSITDYWRSDDRQKGGHAVWEKYFAPLNSVNFGISADRTQHLLWRIEHGEMDALHPQAVVLLIGTNNTGLEKDQTTPRNTPLETEEGVAAIVNALRAKLPETHILLLGLFPRGEKGDPQRAQITEINQALSRRSFGKFVHFLDLGPAFLDADGTLSREIMPDLLHPNERGYEIWASAIKKPLAQLMGEAAVAPEKTIPVVDISAEAARQVVIDREPGQYLGHPNTLLLEDNRTILIVYPKGHGGGGLIYKRSSDGGLTWSERLPTPGSWATSKEVPTLFRTEDAQGKKRLLLFSGTGQGNRNLTVRSAVSEDDGATWSELHSIGNYGGIVTMSSMVRLKDGGYMAFFHDDARFLDAPESPLGKQARILKTISHDGGMTWSQPEIIASHATAFFCEPGALRSPDSNQIALLLRENSRQFHSFLTLSNDEGRTWSLPRELPLALTGDRHVAKYAPDGRLFIALRDSARESSTYGDWVGWVGTFDDLVAGRSGQYRVRLMHNTKSYDCAYSGVELLPDGTMIATTYGHWVAGESPFIVSVRFTLAELDAKLKANARP